MASAVPGAGGTPSPGSGGNYTKIDFDIWHNFSQIGELSAALDNIATLLRQLQTWQVSLSNDDPYVQAWDQQVNAVSPVVQSNFDEAQKLLHGTAQKGLAAVNNIASAEQANGAGA